MLAQHHTATILQSQTKQNQNQIHQTNQQTKTLKSIKQKSTTKIANDNQFR